MICVRNFKTDIALKRHGCKVMIMEARSMLYNDLYKMESTFFWGYCLHQWCVDNGFEYFLNWKPVIFKIPFPNRYFHFLSPEIRA